MKRLLLVLIFVLAASGIRTVEAQNWNAAECVSYDSFPTGWTVLNGTVRDVSQFGYQTSPGQAVEGAPGIVTKYGASTGALVQLHFPSQRYIYSISYATFYKADSPASGLITFTMYNNNYANDIREVVMPAPYIFVGWDNRYQVLQSKSTDDLTISAAYPNSSSTSYQIGLRIFEVCSLPVTVQASSTPQLLYTATPPPTGTATPVPTNTRTPTLTVTAGGPTTTAFPTSTDEPYFAPTVGGGNFSPPTNPPSVDGSEGKFPFDVPSFPSIDLPSPTAVALLGTPSPGPTYSADTSITPAAAAGQQSADDLSTRVNEFADQARAWGTQTYISAQGTVFPDLRNQAVVIGGQAGSLFSVARSIKDGIGRTGDLVIILIALIAFNIGVRVFTFVGTGLIFLWKLFWRVVEIIKP